MAPHTPQHSGRAGEAGHAPRPRLLRQAPTRRDDGKPKGNVDAELVLQAMIEYPNHERAVIVTSDGDFACLVRYLSEHGKLERVISPNRKSCSALLKRAAREKIDFLEDARGKLDYKS